MYKSSEMTGLKAWINWHSYLNLFTKLRRRNKNTKHLMDFMTKQYFWKKWLRISVKWWNNHNEIKQQHMLRTTVITENTHQEQPLPVYNIWNTGTLFKTEKKSLVPKYNECIVINFGKKNFFLYQKIGRMKNTIFCLQLITLWGCHKSKNANLAFVF